MSREYIFNAQTRRLLTALLLCGGLFFPARQTASAQEEPATGNLALQTPVSAVRLAETESEQYLIGPGDVLDIRIFNRPELSRDAVRVDGRNMIRLPLIGEVRAGCLTESLLAQEIRKHYLEYLRNPNVEVFIKDYQSKPAMVIGAVRSPGQFQMRRRVRLLELISFAGGLTERADGRIQVKHEPDTPVCGETKPETSASAKVEYYKVEELLKNKEQGEQIPYVQPGDTINLLEAATAFVVGNVVKPSTIVLKEKTTISKAIAAAGGTLPASRLEKVRILRQTSAEDTTKSEILVDLKAINKQQAEDIVLQANDIVEVPSSSGKKFMNGLVENIVPTISRSAIRVIP